MAKCQETRDPTPEEIERIKAEIRAEWMIPIKDGRARRYKVALQPLEKREPGIRQCRLCVDEES